MSGPSSPHRRRLSHPGSSGHESAVLEVEVALDPPLDVAVDAPGVSEPVELATLGVEQLAPQASTPLDLLIDFGGVVAVASQPEALLAEGVEPFEPISEVVLDPILVA